MFGVLQRNHDFQKLVFNNVICSYVFSFLYMNKMGIFVS